MLEPSSSLLGYGVNLPAWTGTPERSVIPSVLKLFAKSLYFCGKRTTFFGVNRRSKSFAPDLEQLFEWLRDGKISVSIKAIFTLDDIQKANRQYASSERMGSIVIQVSP